MGAFIKQMITYTLINRHVDSHQRPHLNSCLANATTEYRRALSGAGFHPLLSHPVAKDSGSCCGLSAMRQADWLGRLVLLLLLSFVFRVSRTGRT